MDQPRIIESSASTVQWGFLDGSVGSTTSVHQGETVEVRTLTYSPTPESRERLAPGLAAIEDRFGVGRPTPGPHVLVGPIEVEGHLAGQALQVDVVDVWPAVDAGWNMVIGGLGLSPARAGEMDVEVLTAVDGAIELRSGIRLPLRPFFGVLGVRPDPALGRLSTVPPGAFGGNIDCRELVAGTRLLLPTFTDGAGFLIGDGHAVQGDGELSETAMETSMDGVVRLRTVPALTIDRPIGVTPDAVFVLGFGATFDEAAADTVEHTVQALEQWAGLRTVDACRLLTLGCEMRVTQLVNGTVGAHLMVPTAIVEQFGEGWPACLRPDSLGR